MYVQSLVFEAFSYILLVAITFGIFKVDYFQRIGKSMRHQLGGFVSC